MASTSAREITTVYDITLIIEYIKAQNALPRPALPDPTGFVVECENPENITGTEFSMMTDYEAMKQVPPSYVYYWKQNKDSLA